MSALRASVARLRHMQYRADLIDGFLAGTRLDLTPLLTSAIEDR
jgi:hypothetical protein